MVNANPHKSHKLPSSFLQCNASQGSKTPPVLLDVVFNPQPQEEKRNPTLDITISGKFTEDVTKKTFTVVAFVDEVTQQLAFPPTILAACTGSECPVKAGKNFNQTVEVVLQKQSDYPYLIPTRMVVSVANSDTDILGEM
ncbi:15237_t:CDS:2 [Funneliformis mosseae]|uniref:Phosphatidylglycerol/phosphatidylinositol transfer protein n=1 Tax=Funneliformis mosseae TaxID=27381 RepID=A0A9N8WC83_FUNMO|nr:15237_t:CDS:2 [Funneliformis mosseae]